MDKSKRGDGMEQSRQRLVFMAYLIMLVFFLLACRFFYLQTFKAEHLQEKVVEQRVKEIVESPERGKIIDRNGEVLAFSLMAKDISLYPNLITEEKHQKQLATLLSKELDMSYDEVLAKIQAKDADGNPLQWVSLAKRVDVDVATRIKEAGLGGVEIKNAPKRYYPNGTTGSTILGFVNHKNEAGAGVEISLTSYLQGVPGYRLAETDSVGKIIPIGFENISTPLDGQDVTLTIDNYLQHVMEDTLEKHQKELNATAIHAVMMNPNTGEILAMASTPNYDPNDYLAYDERTWNLSPASYVYEPGSTFKPVYMAAALDAGYITKDFTYHDGGTISVNGTTLKNWDSKGLGTANLEDVIVNSSNVGMINISQQMTNKQTVEALKKAGIGQATGIELPGEEIGLFPTAQQLDDDPIRKATISFGQGISVTPVQLVSSFSEIINGGYDVKPHVVQKIEDGFGNTILDNAKEKQEKIYKDSTVKNMKDYLHANMVDGSGRNMQIDGYTMGGKTGSAWFVENGRYVEGEIIGSFMGYAEIEGVAEVALLVVVERPEAEFGSTSGGPPWRDIMEETMRYMTLNDLDEKAETIEVPDVRWMLVDDARATLEDSLDDVKVEVKGKGVVVKEREYRYKDGRIHVTLHTTPVQTKKGYYVPNLIGKYDVEVQKWFKGMGVQLDTHGAGKVAEQSMEPGFYEKMDTLTLWYR